MHYYNWYISCVSSGGINRLMMMMMMCHINVNVKINCFCLMWCWGQNKRIPLLFFHLYKGDDDDDILPALSLSTLKYTQR
jgi:hypothetical protein